MFKHPLEEQWIFDCEFVPCVNTLRAIHGTEFEDDKALLEHAYSKIRGYDPESNPTPILKPVMHKIVSISAIIRRPSASNIKDRLQLLTLPRGEESEKDMIHRFLDAVGRNRPQLVGWASSRFDVPVLFQRALKHSLVLPNFCRRPDKPWEGADYFARYSDYHVDLMFVTASGASQFTSLNETALGCGIPAKVGMDGSQVAEAYLEGRIQDIIDYNECDAATTYLVYLQLLKLGGFVSQQMYNEEQQLLLNLIENKPHFDEFIRLWQQETNDSENETVQTESAPVDTGESKSTIQKTNRTIPSNA